MGCNQAMPTQDQNTAHTANCFVVACMDFRLVDDVTHFMDKIGHNNNYDQFVLAGASLGFTQDKYPEWGKSLLDHMSIGQSLHHFREMIFIDHKDCGAYRKFYDNINASNQKEIHHKHLQMARDKLAKVFPSFKFRAFLMAVDGSVEEMKIDETFHLDPTKVKEDNFLCTLQH